MTGHTALRDAVEETVHRIEAHHPGVIVGAVDVADPRVAIAAAGQMRLPDGPKPGPETLFEIGSITKVFTALVLADAVVRGELTLDTPVRALLPSGVRVPTRDRTEISLEHLATHTSGLPRSPLSLVAELRWALCPQGDPYAELTRDGLYDALGRTRLRRTPGTGPVHYSNFGAGLLGHALVAALDSQDYASLVRDRICTPLGLTDTVVTPDAAQSRRFADGYRRRGRAAAHWELPGLPGAGALRSTVTDLLAFLHAQLRPEASPIGPAIALTHGERRPGQKVGIGLGWLRVPRQTGMMLFHNGGTGGFRSFAAFTPTRGVGVVILVNNDRSPDPAGIRLLDQTATTADLIR